MVRKTVSHTRIDPVSQRGFHFRRDWDTSTAPHTHPCYLQYTRYEGLDPTSRGTGDYITAFISEGDNGPFGDLRTLASNKALERMRDKAEGLTATIGTAVAEYRSCFDMIAKRATQLYRAVQALKRGNVRALSRILGVSGKRVKKRGRRGRFKDLGGLWLEYWMGWAPAIADIHSAVQILAEGPQRPPAVKVTASEKSEYFIHDSWYRRTMSGSCRVSVKLSGRITVSDENRSLAHRLGLTSPLTTLWEITPWSWFVGWFSNVGTYIDSNNWFRGLTITDQYTTMCIEGKSFYGDSTSVIVDKSAFRCTRSLGWPTYQLVLWDPPTRLSITRAATAISLLVGAFKT